MQNNIDLSSSNKIKSSQISLRCIKKIDSLDEIPASIFDDVREFASKNNFTFIEGVTSIILTATVKDKYTYYILFRFVVSESH